MDQEFRQRVVEALQRGEELPAEWARELFPPEKREYELVYHGKEREADILADTMAVPLQPAHTFGGNAVEWHNKLIFGDTRPSVLQLLPEGTDLGQGPRTRPAWADNDITTTRSVLCHLMPS